MTNSDDNRCVLLFVKNPVAGKVKTRLAARIGDEGACELYKHFVLDMLDMLEGAGFDPVLVVHPGEACGELAEWLGETRCYWPQEGAGLGERMKNAFVRAYDAGVDKAVLVGSDIPDLGAEVVADAFTALDSCDAVLGPARDGGYYLIGFTGSGMLAGAFENVEWGGPNVFSRAVEILRAGRRKVGFVSEWDDVDTIADMEELMRRSGERSGDLRTISYILEKGLLPVDDTNLRGTANG